MGTPSKTVSEIASFLGVELNNSEVVRLITTDSRKIVPGAMFIAIKGPTFDGHNAIKEAIQKGAVAILSEVPVENVKTSNLVVKNTREIHGALLHWFQGDPTSRLEVWGVTGTNGKTTSAYILSELSSLLNRSSARLGTIGAALNGEKIDAPELTTPGAEDLSRVASYLIQRGAETLAMEASSHAIQQGRLSGVQFDGVIFTNLTQDHLDYHGTMEEYALAKEGIFELLRSSKKAPKAASINIDDGYGRKFFEKYKSSKDFNCVSCGFSEDADFRILEVKEGKLTICYRGVTEVVNSPFIGRHNALNLAGVLSLLTQLGGDFSRLISLVPRLPQVPGRLEVILARKGKVYVDYAHTPDAIIQACGTVKEVTSGKLIVIFGCGGDRDRKKRPLMGEAAAGFADLLIITSDNPRTEDPLQIIDDIFSGDNGEALRAVATVEPDRRKAIQLGVAMLEENDALLIAGKGHEDYQIIGREKFHFSDQEEVRKCSGDL